jgi:uncharacterized protein YggE
MSDTPVTIDAQTAYDAADELQHALAEVIAALQASHD